MLNKCPEFSGQFQGLYIQKHLYVGLSVLKIPRRMDLEIVYSYFSDNLKKFSLEFTSGLNRGINRGN